jgi:glucokinase
LRFSTFKQKSAICDHDGEIKYPTMICLAFLIANRCENTSGQNREHFLSTTAIGIDLGATKIAAALVTETGQVLASRTLPTLPEEGVVPVLERISALANELSQYAATLQLRMLGIGIGSPGLVDPEAGSVHNAVNLGWQYVSLADELKARLKQPAPVWVQKDGNASAIGEYVFGAAQNCRDFLYLSIGTGLGGGLFAGGQLITGANWNATELGHISLDPLGRPCMCGLKGCAETVLSGNGLVTVFNTLSSLGTPASNISVPAASKPEISATAEIILAAKNKDVRALAAFAEMGRCLGIVIAFCAAVTNPALVVIGGGLGLAVFDLIVPPARMEVKTRVLQASCANLQIVPSLQKSSAVGAASLAWYFSERR